MDVLERQLRSLPPATPPATLLERLRADIPDLPSSSIRVPAAGVRRFFWAFASAAVVLVAVGLAVTQAGNPPDAAVLPQNILRRVDVDHSQETNPCAILPPLPPASHS